MLGIPQQILNKIAQMEPTRTLLGKQVLEATQVQADKMEEYPPKEISAALKGKNLEYYSADRMARAIFPIIILLVENKAITNYITKTNNFSLRNAIPEVLTIDEAMMFLIGDNQGMSEQDIRIAREVMTILQEKLLLLDEA